MKRDVDERERSMDRKSGAKRPYSKPKLVAYGDFRALTGVKGGRLGDGKAKGNSRLSGSKRQ